MGPALHCFLSIFQVELIIKMSTGHCDLFDVKFWSWCPDSKFLKIFHALVCVKFCLDCNRKISYLKLSVWDNLEWGEKKDEKVLWVETN